MNGHVGDGGKEINQCIGMAGCDGGRGSVEGARSGRGLEGKHQKKRPPGNPGQQTTPMQKWIQRWDSRMDNHQRREGCQQLCKSDAQCCMKRRGCGGRQAVRLQDKRDGETVGWPLFGLHRVNPDLPGKASDADLAGGQTPAAQPGRAASEWRKQLKRVHVYAVFVQCQDETGKTVLR